MVQNQDRVFKRDLHHNNSPVGSHFWSNTGLIKSDGLCYQQQGFSALGDAIKKGAYVASFLWSTLVLIDLFPTLKIYILNPPIFEVCCTAVKKSKSHEFSCFNSHPSQTVCDWDMTGLPTDQTNTHMLSQVRCEDSLNIFHPSSCLVDQHYVLIGRMDERKSASFSRGFPISRGSRQPVSSQDR